MGRKKAIYVYHFHALHQPNSSVINHFDGILERSAPIWGIGDYDDAKAVIAEKMAGRPKPETVVIDSLSFLGTRKS
jgi:hypothetical protein